MQHSTQVLAETVIEAAALGLRYFREQSALDDEGVLDLRVEITTTTVHTVPITKLRAWLESGSMDPSTHLGKLRSR